MGVRRLLLRRQVIKCSVMAETERVGKAERFCRGKILRIWPWIGLWEMRENQGQYLVHVCSSGKHATRAKSSQPLHREPRAQVL